MSLRPPAVWPLWNELRVELDLWTMLMGVPRLVIEIMTPSQVREASLAALAPSA